MQRVQSLVVHCLLHVVWIWIWLWSVEISVKVKISLLIFIAHFVIDLSRPHIEAMLIPKDKFIIFQKKSDVLLWFKGKANEDVKTFLDMYFYRWLLTNVLDQGMHIASIAFCAVLFG